MNILDIVLFIVKYIPFWAVPVGLMSIHFAYLYWLKGYREVSYIWGAIVLFCLTSIAFYLILGGPDQITSTITHIIN